MTATEAVEIMCNRCMLHEEVCGGTGCGPRLILKEIAEEWDESQSGTGAGKEDK